MQGVPSPASQSGIIPRVFEHIFESMSVSDGIKYLCSASYLEIYNENLRDLLNLDSKQKLELKENPDKVSNVFVLALIENSSFIQALSYSSRFFGSLVNYFQVYETFFEEYFSIV